MASLFTKTALEELRTQLNETKDVEDWDMDQENKPERKNIFLNTSKDSNIVGMLLAQREIDLEKIDEIKSELYESQKETNDLDKRLHYSKLELSNVSCDLENLKKIHQETDVELKKFENLRPSLKAYCIANILYYVYNLHLTESNVMLFFLLAGWSMFHFFRLKQ